MMDLADSCPDGVRMSGWSAPWSAGEPRPACAAQERHTRNAAQASQMQPMIVHGVRKHGQGGARQGPGEGRGCSRGAAQGEQRQLHAPHPRRAPDRQDPQKCPHQVLSGVHAAACYQRSKLRAACAGALPPRATRTWQEGGCGGWWGEGSVAKTAVNCILTS